MFSLFLRPNHYPLQVVPSAFSQVYHILTFVTLFPQARLFPYENCFISPSFLVCWRFSRALKAVPLGFPFLSYLVLMYRDTFSPHGCYYLGTILSIQSQLFQMQDPFLAHETSLRVFFFVLIPRNLRTEKVYRKEIQM